MINTIPRDNHLKNELKNPDFAIAYLNESLKSLRGESVEIHKKTLLKTLRLIIEVHGISSVARESGVNRANLYRQIAENGNPRIETIMSILNTLNFDIQVIPKGSG